MSELSAYTTEELLAMRRRVTGEEDESPPEGTTPDLSAMSTEELLSMRSEVEGSDNQPGAYTGFSDSVKESVADVVGLPGTVIEYAVNSLGSSLGLPEFRTNLSGDGLKSLMASHGVTSGLKFEERTEAGKMGARAGQVVGYSLPIFGATGLAAKATNLSVPHIAGYNPTWWRKMIDFAAQTPKTWAAVEAGGISGAATGGVIMEGAFPGNDLALIVGETLGALVNPFGQAAKLTGATYKSAKNAIGSYFSKEAKELQALEIIEAMAKEFGEDLPTIIKMLNQAEVGTVSLTSAMKTGSPTMIALESKLVQTHPSFSNKVHDIQNSVFAEMRGMIDNLTATGDPDLLRLAAKMRQQYFDDIINERIRAARRGATEAAARVTLKGHKSQPSTNIHAMYEQALKDLRKVEAAEWKKIPQDVNLIPTNVRAAYKEVHEEFLLKGENLPGIIEQQIRVHMKNGTTTGEMDKLRKRLGSLASEARANGKDTEYAMYTRLRAATKADLEATGLDEVKNAVAFSDALHKRFLDTFAGRTLDVNRRGVYRIQPEEVLEKAFGAGGTRGNIRMRDLVNAGEYADDILKPMFGDAVRNEQERFLRMVANDVMVDGVVDAAKLQRFMTNNAELLERFPALAGQLQNAGDATRLLKKTEGLAGQANKAIVRKSAFAQVLETENPTLIVGKTLDGKNPSADYTQLAKLARRGGDGATAGLRTSTLDHAVSKATTPQGLSFVKLEELLLKAPRGQSSYMGLMKKNGVADTEFLNNLRLLVRRAAQIERAAGTQRKAGELVGDPDQFFDLLVRVAGANIGGASAVASSSGAGLVIAGATVRTMRNYLEKIPATRVVDVFLEAAENPQYMSYLLQKIKSPEQARRVGAHINSAMIAAGIVAARED